ncbi:MAG: FAD-dependent oxidoreductase [Planctomycetes bacterium]|nr:FAD-dependent oxidoreductase [Planctomycetota bacterium]
MSDARVIIVGAGLAGLSCAGKLQDFGCDVQIIEASDGIGGRVRTDHHEGFLLDRGFQVLLDSYEQARATLDFSGLDLARFEPGAMVRTKGRFVTVSDPIRRPSLLWSTLRAKLGTMSDDFRMLTLRRRARAVGHRLPQDDGGQSALALIQELGFSPAMIETFFRPFFGGVFLESELRSAASSLLFLFGRFSQGFATLPARGMGAIPEQLAKRLPHEAIKTGIRASVIARNSVTTDDGRTFEADAVVLATDARSADQLLQRNRPLRFNGTTCLYYAAPRSPVAGPWLVLDGENTGPINHLCVPSEAHASYAPAGQSLVSVSVQGTDRDEAALERRVREQLATWYGHTVADWRHLKSYRLPEALPAQDAGRYHPNPNGFELVDEIFVCGDHLQHPSIEGAISSGCLTAQAVVERVAAGPSPSSR